MSTANDSTVNTPVAAGDASKGEAIPAASSIATDNVPVARIDNQPPDPVSAGDQTPSAAGANSDQTPGGAATAAAADPFSPAALRLSPDFGKAVGVKKVLLSVPVKKPATSWFVRVHPDDAYRCLTNVIELKENNEIYLVGQALWNNLGAAATFLKPKAFYTATNREGVVFLWPVNLPGDETHPHPCYATAREAALLATKNWLRMSWNPSANNYDVVEATAPLGDPTWPSESFEQLWRIAFKDRQIDSLDHPVLRKLRGEA